MKHPPPRVAFGAIMTCAEAAEHHHVSLSQIGRAVEVGEIEHQRRGGWILLYRPSVEAWRPRSQRRR